MNIAVLAWGSVVWDLRDLRIASQFAPVGPELPLEFARVSGDNRLTLVVDEVVGTNCGTFAAKSVYDDLDDALTNLWKREGSGSGSAPVDIRASRRVGFIEVVSGAQSAKALDRQAGSVRAVQTWAKQHGYEAVIWTALASNFPEKTGSDFSTSAALRHLDALDKLSFARALNYIWSAPPQIETPVRRSVNERWPLRGG